MMRALASLVSGALFGLGLAIADMVNPAKVISFLDVSGSWDPSLAVVLAAAVMVSMIGYAIVTKRSGPLFELKFQIPTRRDIDTRLVLGAVIFGIGWGLVGLCPGPAIAGLAMGMTEFYIFMAAMVGGMAVNHIAMPSKPVR